MQDPAARQPRSWPRALPVAVTVTVTVTPRAAGTKPRDVRAGSSATLGTGGQGGGEDEGRAQPRDAGQRDRRTPVRLSHPPGPAEAAR